MRAEQSRRNHDGSTVFLLHPVSRVTGADRLAFTEQVQDLGTGLSVQLIHGWTFYA
jgi:hypothetical protein